MQRAMLTAVVIVALGGLSASAQERPIPPSRLAQLGLGNLHTMPDPQPPIIWSSDLPTAPIVISPHTIYGQRLIYPATHQRPESLSRQALRWSQRAGRF